MKIKLIEVFLYLIRELFSNFVWNETLVWHPKEIEEGDKLFALLNNKILNLKKSKLPTH